MGFIQSHFEYDWTGGKRILEKAIRLNPNYPTAHLYYGNVFLFNGDTKQGIIEIKKALELDPLSISINWSLANRYYFARNYDRAIEQAQRTLTLSPDYGPAKIMLGLSFLQKKLYTQGIEVFTKLPATEQGRGLLLCYAYAMVGDKIRAKTDLDKILHAANNSLAPSYTPSASSLALAYSSLGEFNEALTQLEKEYESRSVFLLSLKINPEFDPLRSEPRFKALLKKMNFD